MLARACVCLCVCLAVSFRGCLGVRPNTTVISFSLLKPAQKGYRTTQAPRPGLAELLAAEHLRGSAGGAGGAVRAGCAGHGEGPAGDDLRLRGVGGGAPGPDGQPRQSKHLGLGLSQAQLGKAISFLNSNTLLGGEGH